MPAQHGLRVMLAALLAGVGMLGACQSLAEEAGRRASSSQSAFGGTQAASPQGYDRSGWRPADAPAKASVPYWIGVDEAPQRFDAYFPAGGPLQRLADRPGAWYLIVFVALPGRWPVQLMAWQREPSHQLRLSALDGWPGSVAQTAVGLPARVEADIRGRHAVVSAPFTLAPSSQAPGIFVLVEQWSPQGARPDPLWLHASTSERDMAGTPRAAWWQAGESGRPVEAPASPLQPRAVAGSGAAAIELPIQRLISAPPRPAPPFEPWWSR